MLQGEELIVCLSDQTRLTRVALVIGGSLWIMDHLNQNMAPMHQTMQMQR